MLATQDEDGYLGIYAEDLRFQHTIENGEFWAQSSLFRALLGWYEATSDEKVLAAIENAVKKIMEAYPINHSDPFNLKNARGGAGHGITITDALNRLYQLTGKTEYLDYAVFLFNNFDKYNMRDEDVKTKNLLDENYVFNYHSAHTCEQIRSLIVAAYHTKDSVLMLAMDNYFKKMKNHLCASGGPIGDEWFHRRLAHADSTGYEYCSIHELHDSYSFMLQKSGKTKWADKMEWLLFNAAQGARHPKESAVTYCQTDNVYKLKGDLFFYEEKENPNKRFKLSPTHVDVAVCCAPNAGRIYPYYVKAMWMRSENGLVANLFGPSELNTLVNGKKVKIIQQTTYPFDFNVDFIIACKEANEFEIAIRKPAWAKIAVVYSEALLREDDQYLYLEKTWQDGDKIQLIMQADVKTNTDLQGKKYISYGPLVFALPLFGKATEIKRYGNTKFRDLHYEPTQDKKKDLILHSDAVFEVEQGKVNTEFPWRTWKIKTSMMYPEENEKQDVELYPMGSTILRKVCFEQK